MREFKLKFLLICVLIGSVSVAFGDWDPGECAGQPSGDATCDGSVNFADLLALKLSFFKCKGQPGYNCCADFNHDGCVNFADLLIEKLNFFTVGYVPSTGEQSCPP